jgi:hypothetical protein
MIPTFSNQHELGNQEAASQSKDGIDIKSIAFRLSNKET